MKMERLANVSAVLYKLYEMVFICYTQGSPVEVKHVFCQQVSATEYEEQSKNLLRLHMGQLLDSILTDATMSDKEKKAKLKMVNRAF